MITLDVCLELVLPGLSLADKAKHASAAGFRSVEFWFHDFDCDKGEYADRRLGEFAESVEENDLFINNAVVNSPDGGIGGKLVNPDDHAGYLERLESMVPILRKLNCRKAITCAGNALEGVSYETQRAAMVSVLKEAAKIAEAEDLTLMLEPLNTLVDHEGYFLDSPKEAAAIVREVDSPSIRLLYDIYHMQIMAGNVIDTIKQNIDVIGHFHAAGVPGRHELDEGELHYREILRAINSVGYDGNFGLEYVPAGEDHDLSMKEQLRYLSGVGEYVL